MLSLAGNVCIGFLYNRFIWTATSFKYNKNNITSELEKNLRNTRFRPEYHLGVSNFNWKSCFSFFFFGFSLPFFYFFVFNRVSAVFIAIISVFFVCNAVAPKLQFYVIIKYYVNKYLLLFFVWKAALVRMLEKSDCIFFFFIVKYALSDFYCDLAVKPKISEPTWNASVGRAVRYGWWRDVLPNAKNAACGTESCPFIRVVGIRAASYHSDVLYGMANGLIRVPCIVEHTPGWLIEN